MSEALDKAKAAIADAATCITSREQWDADILPRRFLRLLDVARVQATIAQAEALEKIAGRLDTAAFGKRGIG